MNSKKEYAYLSIYNVRSNAPLWRQLAVQVHGLGTTNTLYVLGKLFPEKEPRQIRYDTLSAEEIKKLEQVIEQEQLLLDSTPHEVYHANSKNRIISEDFASQSVSDAVNCILLNNTFKANQKLNIKRLVKMNCLIGHRHFKNYKVHGQSTKSTGRKNKITRGFVKKKQQKKLERKTNLSKGNT